jgi:hypothetical protein
MLSNIKNRFDESVKVHWAKDKFRLALLRLQRPLWPCPDRKILVVGCESSGTTVISHLLLRGGTGRFFFEGVNGWVWNAYESVYQGHRRMRDYPRLQLYDRIKVPGFAAILPQFIEEYPNTQVVYCIRDPRDVLPSAYRTKRITTRQQLANITWVRETWLGIEETDPVARLARRWSIYLERSQQVPNVHYVRYEDFCADKLGTIRRLAKAVGIEIDEQKLAQSKDEQASAPDVRSYTPHQVNSWKNSPFVSQKDIRIIEEICGPQMEQWNYRLSEVKANRTVEL